jgi:hypothetical protein
MTTRNSIAVTLGRGVHHGATKSGPGTNHGPARSSGPPGPKPVTVQNVKIHGPALEGNLEVSF